MAKDGRTEKATPQRIKKAREEGNISKSKEMSTFFSLATLMAVVFYLGGWFIEEVKNIFKTMFYYLANDVDMFEFAVLLGTMVLKVFFPIILIYYVSVFLNYFIQVKFLLSPKIVAPQVKRINPVNYFKNLFSKKVFFDIVKSFVIFITLGLVLYSAFISDASKFSGSVLLDWRHSFVLLWGVFKDILFKIVVCYLIIALIDYRFQKFDYQDNLKMKKEEVKREMKEQDGAPEVKRRQRQMMMEILKKEVVSKVPESTFIAVNPTHYSVAVQYKKGRNPIVLVKGVDNLALYMREIAKNSDIPIIENPAFARELYNRVSENEEIPSDMWEVLSKIMHQLVASKKIKLD